MNKEQQELLNEAYEKYLEYTINGIETGLDKIKGYLDGCLVEYDGYYEHFTNPSFAYGYRTYNQEEFINKIKTDTEFSKKWGLKIEERELSHDERVKIACKQENGIIPVVPMYGDWDPTKEKMNQFLNENKTPTKLITLTYNNETIENYE